MLDSHLLAWLVEAPTVILVPRPGSNFSVYDIQNEVGKSIGSVNKLPSGLMDWILSYLPVIRSISGLRSFSAEVVDLDQNRRLYLAKPRFQDRLDVRDANGIICAQILSRRSGFKPNYIVIDSFRTEFAEVTQGPFFSNSFSICRAGELPAASLASIVKDKDRVQLNLGPSPWTSSQKLALVLTSYMIGTRIC